MARDDASTGSNASSSSEDSFGSSGWGDPQRDPTGGTGQDPGATTTNVQNIVVKPKQGGLQLGSDGVLVAWTGGKPSPDWDDGLQDKDPIIILPTQSRTDKISGATKAQYYRTLAPETKFGRDGDMLLLQKRIMQHFEDHGLDTITYLPDPMKKDRMISIVTSYPRYTLDEAIEAERPQKEKYDKYDHLNSQDAVKYLLSSLTPELEGQLYQNCNRKESFIVHWMHLTMIVGSISIDQFERLKAEFRQRDIKDYPGEDIEAMSSDFFTDYQRLNNAQAFEHNMLMVVIHKMMEAGNEDFKHFMRVLKVELNKYLMRIRNMDYELAQAYLVRKQADLHNLLRRIKEAYRIEKDQGRWPAASHAKDSKAVSNTFGTINKAQFDALVEAKVNSLVRNQGGPSKGGSTNLKCHQCGQKGHFKKDCPQLKNKGGSNKNKKGGKKIKEPRWPKPGPGKSEIKVSEKGTRYLWCEHCGDWRVSHGTKGHKTKEELQKIREQSDKINTLVDVDVLPAAYYCKETDGLIASPDEAVLWEDLSPSPMRSSEDADIEEALCLEQEQEFVAPGGNTRVMWDLFIQQCLEPKYGCLILGLLSLLAIGGSSGCVALGYLAGYATALYGQAAHKKFLLLRHRYQERIERLSRRLTLLLKEKQHQRRRRADVKRYYQGLQTGCPRRRQSMPNRVPREHVWNDHEDPSTPGAGSTPLSVPNDTDSVDSNDDSVSSHYDPTRKVRFDPGAICSEIPNSGDLIDPHEIFHDDSSVDDHYPIWEHVNMAKLRRKGGMLRTGIRYNTGEEKVLFDTGANCCATHNKADFVGNYEAFHDGRTVEGIGKCLTVEGRGHVAWTFMASNGMARTLKVPCNYVPGIPHRIMSTQQLLRAYPGETITVYVDDLRLSGLGDRPSVLIPIDRNTLLPFGTLVTTTPTSGTATEGHISSFSDDTDHTPPLEEDLTGNSPNTPDRHHAGTTDVQGQDELTPAAEEAAAWERYNQEVRSDWKIAFQRELHTLEDDVRRASIATNNVMSANNVNLTDAARTLLDYHFKFGHMGLRRVQWILKNRDLQGDARARRLRHQAARIARMPLCAACQFAKQRAHATPGNRKLTNQVTDGSSKRDVLYPGQKVSVDHFSADPKGRLISSYGKERHLDKFTGGCIFVDHASNFVYIALQVRLNTHETLRAKELFERAASQHGVVISHYQADNGTAFRNEEWTAHLQQFNQTTSFAGVGAHHSQGVVERMIGIILSISRAMLFHYAIHWPDVAQIQLWPLAVLHATYLHNHLPRPDSGLSPLELFSRIRQRPTDLSKLHVWGAPAYVLDKTIADGKSLPRWRPRSGRFVHVGISPDHRGMIPLVMNLDTGKITPQFHVVLDDHFSTVTADHHSLSHLQTHEWQATFGLTPLQYFPEDDDDEASASDAMHASSPQVPHFSPKTTPPVDYTTSDTLSPKERSESVPSSVPLSLAQREKKPREATVPVPPVTKVSPKVTFDSTTQVSPSPSTSPPVPKSPPPSILKRPSTPPPLPDRRVTRSMTARTRQQKAALAAKSTHVKPSISATKQRESVQFDTTTLFPDFVAPDDPIAVDEKAFWMEVEQRLQEPRPNINKVKSNPDVFGFDVAISREDWDKWEEAMNKEIRSLEEQGTWEEVPISSAKDSLVPCQWVFQVKRRPGDGTAYKWKGRLVLRGDLHKYNGETTSPVASWSTIRTMLAFSVATNRVTCTIDFSNAFVQSPLPVDEPIWMRPPRGYRCSKGDDHCLRLKKSLYGHKAASRYWSSFIGRYFKKLGLTQSNHDPCLWYGRGLILVQYVDDMGISAENMEQVDAFVAELRAEGLTLTKEESFAEFLGINFVTHEDGSIEMTQGGLIKKVLETAGMTNCNPNAVPAFAAPLTKDPEGEPMDEQWSYREIVGMLLYLGINTRPDITLANSQVARFSNDPKKSHATGVKVILRYLKGTQDKGTIVRIQDLMHLEMFVDADFAGMYGYELPEDPMSVKSRSGYIIKLGSWPIIWKSYLQGHQSSSTLESEYSALSDALKVLIPLIHIVKEMASMLENSKFGDTVVKATVFEDNQGAYFLATKQKLSARTKHYALRYHWFWSKYNEGLFKISPCPTELQDADWLTKPLTKDKFRENRKRVMGW